MPAILRQRPDESGLVRAAHALLHRRARRADRRRDLPIGKTRGLEPQYLANLAHGQPLLRHRRPPSCWERRPWWPGLTRVTPYADMLRNGGPAWPGTLARHAPESVAGMVRNPQPLTRCHVSAWDRRLGKCLRNKRFCFSFRTEGRRGIETRMCSEPGLQLRYASPYMLAEYVSPWELLICAKTAAWNVLFNRR